MRRGIDCSLGGWGSGHRDPPGIRPRGDIEQHSCAVSELYILASCSEVRRTSSLDIPEMDLYAECTQFLEVAALEMTARGLTRAKFLRSAGQSRKIACGIRSA